MAYIIKINGKINEVQPKNGTDFQLDELQAIVGGYIEIINLGNGEIMVLNDEGKFSCECKCNSVATSYAKMHNAIYSNDYIAGDVLVCNANQIK